MLCVMLSAVPGFLALNEALKLGHLVSKDQVPPFVEDAYVRIRHQVLSTGTAPSRNADGRQVMNHFARTPGERNLLLKKSDIQIHKNLDENFILGVKHNAIFTLALRELCHLKWPLFAIIRNPLAVLGSWNTLEIPVSAGRMKNLGQLEPELHKEVQAQPDLLRKQVLLLDFYFRQYKNFIAEKNILRYERLCSSPSDEISKIAGSAQVFEVERVENLNQSSIYPRENFPDYFNALSELPDAAWRHFYEEAELLELMDSKL